MRYTKGDFSAGELSPSLYGRPEFPVFATGVKVMKNALPLPAGGWCNRPGTRAVAMVKSAGTKWRLVSFVFSTGDAFALEFGEYYIRFFKGYAPVLSGGVPVEVVTPWASADIPNLKFTQSADTLFICDGSHQQRTLARVSDTSWTISTYDYLKGPFMLENAGNNTITPSAASAASVTLTSISKANPGVVTKVAHGFLDGDIVYISGVAGMTEVNDLPFKVRNKAADTFELDYNGAGASLDTSGYTAAGTGGTAKKCVTLTATGTWPSSAAGPFSNITDYKHSSGRALWKINHWIGAQSVSATFAAAGTGTAIKCGGTWRIVTHDGAAAWTGTVKVQVSEDGVTWSDSRVYIGKGDKNWDTYVTETFAPQFYVRVDVTAMTVGSCQIDLSSDPFEWTGTVRTVQVPTGGGGSSQMYDTADALVIDTLGDTTATKVWAEGSWSDYRGYPACLAFYQDRLCFAGTRGEADTVWMSKSGNYYDFGWNFPIQDDDGISVRMSSREYNLIRNLINLNSQISMTSSGLFSLNAGQNSALTPATVNIKANDMAGASALTPAVVNDRIVYAQTFNKIIRDSGYSFETDGYLGINLNQYSEHLFKEYQAVEMAYQKEPWQTLWIVRSDGKLLSLTYQKQAEIYGWALHSTNGGYHWPGQTDDQWKDAGKFLSVCSVPGTAQDDVWVIVERTGYGLGSVRSIEYFSNRNATTDPMKQVFLDCSYEYDDSKTITDITQSLAGAPAVVTSAAHGYSNDDLVDVSGIYDDGDRYDVLNGMRFMVKNKTTDTFELYDAATGLVPYSTYGKGAWDGGGVVRKCITSMTGMTCLNGMPASFLANAYPKPSLQYVAAGSAVIGGAHGVVQAGLPFYSDVETMPIDFDTTAGSTQGKLKEVKKTDVSLFNTYGGKIGFDRADMKEMTDTMGGVLHHILTSGLTTGTPPDLFTSTYKQATVSGSRNSVGIIIRQEDPYPITVLSLAADVELSQ